MKKEGAFVRMVRKVCRSKIFMSVDRAVEITLDVGRVVVLFTVMDALVFVLEMLDMVACVYECSYKGRGRTCWRETWEGR